MFVFLFLVLWFIIHNFSLKDKYELKYKNVMFVAINGFTVYLALYKFIYKFLLFQNITHKISNMAYIETLLNWQSSSEALPWNAITEIETSKVVTLSTIILCRTHPTVQAVWNISVATLVRRKPDNKSLQKPRSHSMELLITPTYL